MKAGIMKFLEQNSVMHNYLQNAYILGYDESWPIHLQAFLVISHW